MIDRRLMRCGVLTAALLVGGSPAIAQTLHDFTEAAGARNPDLAALEGRGNAISARQRAAGAWTPGPPTFTAGYATDQAFRDRQQREASIGISTPLWLPGEGTASHPRLDDARGALELARANRALVDIQTRDSPEIGLIARRSRDYLGTVFNTKLGVEIKIPFSSEARNAPRQAMAQAEFKEAMALRLSAEREVAAELQKARLAYDNALAQRDLASERARTLIQQVALVSRGQRGGEVSFPDFIRARTLAHEAAAAKARAEVNVAKARGRLNQSLGMIP